MRYNRKTVLISTFMVLSTSLLNAQFLKDLGKRVEKSVENTISRKTEQKAEEKTEEAMDTVFDAGKKKKEKKAKEASSNSDASSYSNASYTFNFTATIEITPLKKKKAEKMITQQSYGKESLLTSTSGHEIIFDFLTEDVLMMDSANKTVQVMSMKWFTKKANEITTEKADDSENNNVTFERTGRSKIMNGYACHEYLITHDDGKTIAWLAPNVPFGYTNYVKSFAKSFGKNAPQINSNDGYIMEMTTFDKKDKKTMYLLVTNISKKTRTISLNNYSVTRAL